MEGHVQSFSRLVDLVAQLSRQVYFTRKLRGRAVSQARAKRPALCHLLGGAETFSAVLYLDTTVRLSIADGSMTEASLNAQPDAIIYSQPLHYCLAQTWGMGTLMISGRFTLLRDERNWKAHSALFALNNADVYLGPRYAFRRQNWMYLKDRLNGLKRYNMRTRSRVGRSLFPEPTAIDTDAL